MKSASNHRNLCVCMRVFSLNKTALKPWVQHRRNIVNRCLFDEFPILFKLLLASLESTDNAIIVLSKLAVTMSCLVKELHHFEIDAHNSANCWPTFRDKLCILMKGFKDCQKLRQKRPICIS
jgi:hypothetical protein